MKMNANRAQELLPPLKKGTAIGISQHWRMHLIEALEYVIEHDTPPIVPANTTCESCGDPARDDDDYCYGCQHIVCVACAQAHGHISGGAHGFKKIKKGRRSSGTPIKN